MPITVMCPNLACRALLRVPDNVRGQRVRCSQCTMVFTVPAQPSAKPKSAERVPAEEKPAKERS